MIDQQMGDARWVSQLPVAAGEDVVHWAALTYGAPARCARSPLSQSWERGSVLRPLPDPVRFPARIREAQAAGDAPQGDLVAGLPIFYDREAADAGLNQPQQRVEQCRGCWDG